MFPQPYFAKGYWPGTYFPPTGEPPPEGAMWATVTGAGTLGGTLTAVALLEADLLGEGVLAGLLRADSILVSPTGGGEFLSERIIRARIAAGVHGHGEAHGRLSFVVGEDEDALWLLLN